MSYLHNALSKYQCGYRNGFTAHHGMLYSIEKSKLISNGKEAFTTVMSDFLKIFDCISHELQLANLKVPMASMKYH